MQSGKWGYACCHSCVKASYCGAFLSLCFALSFPSLPLPYTDVLHSSTFLLLRRAAGQASIEAANAEASGNIPLLASNPFAKGTDDAARDEGKSLVQLKKEREEEERRKRKAGEGDDGKDEDGKKRKKDAGDAMGVTEEEMGALLLLPLLAVESY